MPEPLLVGEKLPRPVDRLALEVIAEAEVAQHLEKRVVIRRAADVVDVAGPQALLAGRGPRELQLHLAQEVVLELVHAGRREQHATGPTSARARRSGTRLCPFVSKKARYFSRSSSVFIRVRFRGRAGSNVACVAQMRTQRPNIPQRSRGQGDKRTEPFETSIAEQPSARYHRHRNRPVFRQSTRTANDVTDQAGSCHVGTRRNVIRPLSAYIRRTVAQHDQRASNDH